MNTDDKWIPIYVYMGSKKQISFDQSYNELGRLSEEKGGGVLTK